jgi:3-hydroxybutyryl-CoA dehydratase
VRPEFGMMPEASVGETATADLVVSRSTIDEFAALTGDDNPLHVEPDYAADSLFDGPVAHGMLAASTVSSALADLPGGVVYLSQDLEFLSPVRPGERIVATVEVVEDLGGDRVRVETTAATDEPVLQGEAVVLSVAHEPDRPTAEGREG